MDEMKSENNSTNVDSNEHGLLIRKVRINWFVFLVY